MASKCSLLPLSCVFFCVIYASVLSSEKSPCVSSTECKNLKDCQPFMTIIDNSQKPLPSMLKFMKAQICGFSEEEPRVCCPKPPMSIADHRQLNESFCKASLECVTLRECAPLAYLFNLEKPITPGILKFIRSQQCGSDKTVHPRVCCKISETARFSTTEKIVGKLTLREKADAMNWIFVNSFYDFDLFI